MQSWIAVDIETTGLSPTRHLIRELAAVPFGIHEQSETLVYFARDDFRPSGRRQTRRKLAEMVGDGALLVAHNAAFDIAFLAEALRHAGLGAFTLRAYCTLRLARQLLPELQHYDLSAMRQTLGIHTGKAHAALADAQAVAALFIALVQRAGFTDEDAIRKLHGPPVQVRVQSGLRGAL